jgi:hypothetical protein
MILSASVLIGPVISVVKDGDDDDEMKNNSIDLSPFVHPRGTEIQFCANENHGPEK